MWESAPIGLFNSTALADLLNSFDDLGETTFDVKCLHHMS